MLSTRWEEKGLGWTLSFIHYHLPDRIEDGDKLGSCDCKFEENISSECNLSFFLIKRENIQVTVKSRVKLRDRKAHNRPSIAVDSELFQGCMQSVVRPKPSQSQQPIIVNIKNQ